ncbi:MAG: methyltransferase domain-containing protein [Gemmataceae bacterium]
MELSSHQLPPGPKLNLGCGPVQPEGWVNIDGSNRAWFSSRLAFLDRLLVQLRLLPPSIFNSRIKICNLLKPLPYADNSVSCIYAGELWEHLEYPDAERLTAECFRVLAPNGVLRIRVPDGIEFWETYLELHRMAMATPRAERSAEKVRKHVEMYFREICTRRLWFASMGHTHKWQFDEVQLVELFESVGFTAVDRMDYQKSRISDVASVELKDRLMVEGVKANSQ